MEGEEERDRERQREREREREKGRERECDRVSHNRLHDLYDALLIPSPPPPLPPNNRPTSFAQERALHHHIGRLLYLRNKIPKTGSATRIADKFPAKMREGLDALESRGRRYTLEMRGRYNYALRMCGILRPRPKEPTADCAADKIERTWEKMPRQAWQDHQDEYRKAEEKRDQIRRYPLGGRRGADDSESDEGEAPATLLSVAQTDTEPGFAYSSKMMFSYRSGELKFESSQSLR